MLTLEFVVSLLTCHVLELTRIDWMAPMRHPSQTATSLHTTIPHNDWHKQTQKKVLPRNHLKTSEQVAASCCMRLQILRWFLCSLDNSPPTPTSKSKHTLGWSLTTAAPVALLFFGLSRFSLIHGGLTKSHVPQGATKTWSTLVLQKMGWYRF